MRFPLQPLKRGSRQRGVHHHQHAMLFRDWPAPPSLPSFAVLPAGSGLHSPSHGSQRENGYQAQILSFDRKHRSTARGMLLSRDLVARPECHWTSSRTRPSKIIQQLTTDVVQENSPGQRSEMFRRENGIRGGGYTPGEVGTMSCAPWRGKSLLLLLPGKLSSVTKRKESKGKSENSVWQWHLDCLRPRRVSKRSVDRQHVLLAALDPVIMHPRV